MTTTPEEIMAYVDGELNEPARSRITLAALADMDLAERIAAERQLRERLIVHYAPVSHAPVPPQWAETIHAAMAEQPAPVIDLAAARARKATLSAKPRWWQSPAVGAAMAASLVLGVFVGTQWHSKADSGPITARNGALVASGDLAIALDTQLASAPGNSPIRMLATFRRQGGGVCRAFAGPQASGIACNDAGSWQLQHVLPGKMASSVAYQQAGAQNGELMAIAQNMAVGEPLDAGNERKVKNNRWR